MDAMDDGDRREARFLFDPEMVRAADRPSEESARLVWMIVSLVKSGEVALSRYEAYCRRRDRTFKRDVAKLRELGERYGFRLSRQTAGRVRLEAFEGAERVRPNAASGAAAAAETLQAVVDALGDVIGRELAGHVDLAGSSADRFLRIATPRLIAQTAVADTYARLRAAWTQSARVRFRYPSRERGTKLERTVEPYLITYVEGRYYLVGFDVRPRSGGWRQFALDRIVGPIAPAGSFRRRAIPAAYRGEDAIGLFKTGPAVEVTVGLSSTIAEAVIAREWQRSQRSVREPGGGATITFEVYDLGEAVRWAMSFGPEARVVAPPEAVRLAGRLAVEVAAGYAPAEQRSRLA